MSMSYVHVSGPVPHDKCSASGRDSQDEIVGGESVKSRQFDLEVCLAVAVDVAFHKRVAILLKAD